MLPLWYYLSIFSFHFSLHLTLWCLYQRLDLLKVSFALIADWRIKLENHFNRIGFGPCAFQPFLPENHFFYIRFLDIVQLSTWTLATCRERILSKIEKPYFLGGVVSKKGGGRLQVSHETLKRWYFGNSSSLCMWEVDSLSLSCQPLGLPLNDWLRNWLNDRGGWISDTRYISTIANHV